MKEQFRKKHLISILENFEKKEGPLDAFLSDYFRKAKSIGSKDRKYIAEYIYTLIRWKGLVDYFTEKPLTWEKRVTTLQSLDIKKILDEKNLPSHISVSFPKDYFDLIKKDYGEEKALEICFTSNTPAPTIIRANGLKISRDELFEKLKIKYEVAKCEESSNGIIFLKKINFFAAEEFKQGLFEVQDEGSQLIADLVSPQPTSLVLDYCAGSGGKTLAFACKMQNRGQIFLHDIRKNALLEAKKRLRRAGIQNSQLLFPEEIDRKLKNKKMDWILLDVPCSGSGTLRRNPDMKWKWSSDMLEELLLKQRQIFHDSTKFLKKNGLVVYSTCSIFRAENENQVDFFLKSYPFELIKIISWSPLKDRKDGFFGALLKKK